MILDEVLAVGDAAFQKKCFDRMSEIIGEGHASILVSHGMGEHPKDEPDMYVVVSRQNENVRAD
jgi:ABC-type polysaccharide/polyol phosphate transport system ATPase subunit